MLRLILSLCLLLPACQPKGDDTALDTGSECDFSADPCDSGTAWITTCEVYPTIQGALDAATNGTTVHVCAGNHTEALVVAGGHADEHVNLNGEGSEVTTIDAAGLGFVLTVGADVDLDMAGLTLTGGTGEGGGISVSEARLVLSDVSITANSADRGPAIFATGADVRLTECAVTSNTSVTGGAVQLDDTQFQSIRSDWGEGATDNIPADVALGSGAIYQFGADASFTCSSETFSCVED